jgi:antitoxin VapB
MDGGFARSGLALLYIIWYRPSGMSTAKVFMNGRSQAIRLPKAFRVRSAEVQLKRVPEGILIMERDPWEVCHEACQRLSDEFFQALEHRGRLPQQPRDWTGVFE